MGLKFDSSAARLMFADTVDDELMSKSLKHRRGGWLLR